MKIIELNEISKSYKTNLVLDKISYIFMEASCYLIVGSNGSGKSSLLKGIIGINNYSSGTLTITDEKKGRIAYIPEKIIFPDYVSIIDFLSSLANIGVSEKVDIEVIEKYLEEWKLSAAKDKYLKNLSKGMIQKVLIIQGLLVDANIYIFDEPLNGLDDKMQNKFMEIIRDLKEMGKTILISTHYKEKFRKLADVILKIENGMINEKLIKVSL